MPQPGGHAGTTLVEPLRLHLHRSAATNAWIVCRRTGPPTTTGPSWPASLPLQGGLAPEGCSTALARRSYKRAWRRGEHRWGPTFPQANSEVRFTELPTRRRPTAAYRSCCLLLACWPSVDLLLGPSPLPASCVLHQVVGFVRSS